MNKKVWYVRLESHYCPFRMDDKCCYDVRDGECCKKNCPIGEDKHLAKQE